MSANENNSNKQPIEQYIEKTIGNRFSNQKIPPCFGSFKKIDAFSIEWSSNEQYEAEITNLASRARRCVDCSLFFKCMTATYVGNLLK